MGGRPQSYTAENRWVAGGTQPTWKVRIHQRCWLFTLKVESWKMRWRKPLKLDHSDQFSKDRSSETMWKQEKCWKPISYTIISFFNSRYTIHHSDTYYHIKSPYETGHMKRLFFTFTCLVIHEKMRFQSQLQKQQKKLRGSIGYLTIFETSEKY